MIGRVFFKSKDNYNSRPNFAGQNSGGFTLIEAVISIGIFALFASIVLLRYGDFQGNILLTNLAYDVSLTIRQAQVYGVAVREASPGDFYQAYGIHFDTANPTQYFVFNEPATGGNRRYLASDTNDMIIKTFLLGTGYSISDLCFENSGGGGWNCVTASVIDIVFVRPSLAAHITETSGGSANYPKAGAKIEFTSSKGGTKSVIVRASGQISVRE